MNNNSVRLEYGSESIIASLHKGTNLTELKRIERTDLLILDDFGLQP